MSFTDQKPWVATQKDCKANWCGRPNGELFCCNLCGYKFKPGDTVRWEYTNNIPGAYGNPLVCTNCDGTKEEVAAKMKEINDQIKSLRERFPKYFCDPSKCEYLY